MQKVHAVKIANKYQGKTESFYKSNEHIALSLIMRANLDNHIVKYEEVAPSKYRVTIIYDADYTVVIYLN